MARKNLVTGVTGWFLFLIICLNASLLWAQLQYDFDGDCDVDGTDIYQFLSSENHTLENYMNGFALEYGGVGECCVPVGIGTPRDGYPNWQERTLIVFTNMVRMAPVEYRDSFMIYSGFQASGILDPAIYPAVHPLYQDHGLSQAARFHAEDMAFNCGLQHDSCDGTSWSDRIRRYYTDSFWISENVAYGFNSPWMTVNLFLCEEYGRACVADGSGDDGHRANIMRVQSREIGAGYAMGSTYFWVQDFGGGIPEALPPVVAATHAFIEDGKTSFFLNYFDPDKDPPLNMQVIIDDIQYLLDLDTGQEQAGSYRVDVTRAAGCRTYFFRVTSGNGTCYRYPGTSYFHTYGEGDCLLDYE